MVTQGRATVLIADDQTVIRSIIKAYFAPYDVEIIQAKSGKEALSVLKSKTVDLLILDYSMPVMSGEDVLRTMVMDEKLKKIPVIVYTGGGFDGETGVWLKKMASAFLEKTNPGKDLIPTVKDILGPKLKKKT